MQYSTILCYTIQLRRPPCLNVHLPTKATVRRSNHPKLENFEWQPTLEIASMQSSYVTQNFGVRISISSRVRHLFIGFNHCERLQALGEWAAERLRAPGVYRVNPLDPSRFSKKFPSSPDHSVKMGGNGFRMFFNFNIFSLHFLTLQVMFYGKIIELPTRW